MVPLTWQKNPSSSITTICNVPLRISMLQQTHLRVLLLPEGPCFPAAHHIIEGNCFQSAAQHPANGIK